MTLQEFLLHGKAELDSSNLHFSDSLQHIEQLVFRTLNWDRTQLFKKKNEELRVEELNRLEEVLARRLKGEPLQYILGFEYFYESRFEVGGGCLIPRKETELLVELVLSYAPYKNIRVVELGAGSGNIGISVLQKRSNVEWHAFEKNPQSIKYARMNVANLLPSKHSYFLHEGDFFEGAKQFAPFDLIVSNPPYLSEGEMAEIPFEVKCEPTEALAAGKEGLDVILKLVEEGRALVTPGAALFCEISSSQKDSLTSHLQARGVSSFEILNDFSGLPRLVRLYFW
jgi:release factor glutamine methyltransferase